MYNRIIYIIGIALRESAVTGRRRGTEKGENIYLKYMCKESKNNKQVFYTRVN